MITKAEKQTDSFLFRLRKQDTPTGISGVTLQALIEITGLSKTELAHFALRKLADAYLPSYEKDEGALTPAQIQYIRSASPATETPEECFTQRLF